MRVFRCPDAKRFPGETLVRTWATFADCHADTETEVTGAGLLPGPIVPDQANGWQVVAAVTSDIPWSVNGLAGLAENEHA